MELSPFHDQSSGLTGDFYQCIYRCILHLFWICVHGLVVSVCYFSVAFYFVDVQMQDSPEKLAAIEAEVTTCYLSIYKAISTNAFDLFTSNIPGMYACSSSRSD